MSDETKKIIRDCNELLNDEFFTLNNIEITRHELNLLLDYITNLQEQLHQASLDIQELTERDIECPSWCNKLTNLQQENERLNNVINELNAKLNQYEEREEMQYLIKDEERFNYSMSDQVDY